MKLAAIDIGSNAIRLLIVNAFSIEGELYTQKDLMVRVPLRLGDQVFLDGEIMENKAKKLLETMASFKNLMNVCDVKHYRAYATSAMRDAANGNLLIEKVKNQADINIEIISGNKESEVIYQSLKPTLEKHPEHYFLNIDVGGGSTELIALKGAEILGVRSFQIGTIRILNGMDEEEEWENMKQWIKEKLGKTKGVIGFGTGGNIRALKKNFFSADEYISYHRLDEVYDYIDTLSLRKLMAIYDFRLDRADVIVPATKIFLNCLKWAKIQRFYVPKMAGLARGVITELYEEVNKK